MEERNERGETLKEFLARYDLDTAMKRELEEETNLFDSTYFRQLYTFGNADRDPRTRVITTVYLSMTPAENIKMTSAGDDAMDTGWFTIQKIATTTDGHERKSVLMLDEEEKGIHLRYEIYDTACDNYVQTRSKLLDSSNAKLAADHIKAINMAIDVVRNRAASTGIMFNLLPKECTLREIQEVYEAIVNHPVDTGNFRRDIKKMLVATGNTTIVNGRKVATYSFNPLLPFVKETL